MKFKVEGYVSVQNAVDTLQEMCHLLLRYFILDFKKSNYFI